VTTRVPAIDLSRSRDVGDIIGGAFSLYWRYFGLFAAIAFAVVIPLDLLAYALEGELRPGMAVPLGLISWLVTIPLITAGHVNAVMTLGDRRDVFAGDALRAAARRLPVVSVTVLLVAVATLLGCVLLIIPGIFVAVRLYVSAQAVVAEDLGPVDGIRRSNQLVEGNGWRVLGISILVGLIAAVLAALAGAPFQIAAVAADSRGLALVGQILTDGFSLSFAALAGTLLYFDLRARHGGALKPSLQYPEFAPRDWDAPERPV
jgi:hypothetical protein